MFKTSMAEIAEFLRLTDNGPTGTPSTSQYQEQDLASSSPSLFSKYQQAIKAGIIKPAKAEGGDCGTWTAQFPLRSWLVTFGVSSTVLVLQWLNRVPTKPKRTEEILLCLCQELLLSLVGKFDEKHDGDVEEALEILQTGFVSEEHPLIQKIRQIPVEELDGYDDDRYGFIVWLISGKPWPVLQDMPQLEEQLYSKLYDQLSA